MLPPDHCCSTVPFSYFFLDRYVVGEITLSHLLKNLIVYFDGTISHLFLIPSSDFIRIFSQDFSLCATFIDWSYWRPMTIFCYDFNSSPCFSLAWNGIVLRNKLCREFATSTKKVVQPVAFCKLLDAKYTDFFAPPFCYFSLSFIRQSHLVSFFQTRYRRSMPLYLLNVVSESNK